MTMSNEPVPAFHSRPGRPRALDLTRQREIIAVISAGFSIERAARYVNCSPSTIRRECRRNPQFDNELRRASLTAQLSPLQSIRAAGRKYWRAAAWLLERLDPERFAKQNPRYLKHEAIEAYVNIIAQIIGSEVADPHQRQRIYDKICALQKIGERRSRAVEDTPPRRRSRLRARCRGVELTPVAREILAEINRATIRNQHPIPATSTGRIRSA